MLLVIIYNYTGYIMDKIPMFICALLPGDQGTALNMGHIKVILVRRLTEIKDIFQKSEWIDLSILLQAFRHRSTAQKSGLISTITLLILLYREYFHKLALTSSCGGNVQGKNHYLILLYSIYKICISKTLNRNLRYFSKI